MPCILSAPCLNNGACANDNEGGYTCTCKSGFEGKFCEIGKKMIFEIGKKIIYNS